MNHVTSSCTSVTRSVSRPGSLGVFTTMRWACRAHDPTARVNAVLRPLTSTMRPVSSSQWYDKFTGFDPIVARVSRERFAISISTANVSPGATRRGADTTATRMASALAGGSGGIDHGAPAARRLASSSVA